MWSCHVFPPRYLVHVDEVHGNGNSFFSPYTSVLAQLVPGFSHPDPFRDSFEKAPENHSEPRSMSG